MEFVLKPIGTIYSPFTHTAGMPIQPAGAKGVAGTIEINAEFAPGLQDLDGFSHILLIYYFHKAARAKLIVTPFLDSQPRGLFSTRAPTRPNPIGLSVVALKKVENRILHVVNLDILNNTPLLDIKPYVPAFDHHAVDRIGWLEEREGVVTQKRADDRFR
jgi:tRNA-Thr(GGU) m(6)t(6)A37 methyltransferase TsaA